MLSQILQKNKTYREKLYHNRLAELLNQTEPCSRVKVMEIEDMVHSRELGIVYSKIESSKAKQTREK